VLADTPMWSDPCDAPPVSTFGADDVLSRLYFIHSFIVFFILAAVWSYVFGEPSVPAMAAAWSWLALLTNGESVPAMPSVCTRLHSFNLFFILAAVWSYFFGVSGRAGIQMLIKRVRLHILAATAHGHNLSFDFTLAGPLAGFDRRGHSTWNPLCGTFRSLPRLSILITQHESTKSGASCTRSVWPDQLDCQFSTFASWTTCLSTYPFFLCLFLLFFSL
jgi:hypothetical protein